jgi:DNA-binding LacI/PurR family transcriptional regulator
MNLHEVARRANVSTATASRVVNNAALVKSTTRARVAKAIEELKYSPNLHARSLAGGKSRSIGVIISNMENPFFLDIYKELEAGARASGYELVMANTGYRSERLLTSIRLMIGRRVAGLAALVSEMDSSLIEELNGSRIPVVFYDVGTPQHNITNIRVNYQRGMAMLISYLYSLGHRRLGFVGHHTTLGPINERFRVLVDAVARYPDLQVDNAADADTLEGGRRATRALLDANPGLTAIVCVNDLMAVGSLRELRESDRRVPEDISVTGFDNIDLAQFSFPALTSVHIPRDKIGRTICDCLMRSGSALLEHEFVIEPDLVVRDSTGPVVGTAIR